MQQPTPLRAVRSADLQAHDRAQRLHQATQWLLEGMRPRDVVAKGIATWGVGIRMAQLYVACARKQLRSDALHSDYLSAHQLSQDYRLKALHKAEAVVKDPQTSDARRRAEISYLSKVTRVMADYENSAKQADEKFRSEKFRQTPLDAVDLHVAWKHFEQDNQVIDRYVEQVEAAAAAEEARASAPPQPAAQRTDVNVQVASDKTDAAGSGCASPSKKRAVAQAAFEPTCQSQGCEHLAKNGSRCAKRVVCAALDEEDLAIANEVARYARGSAPERVQESAAPAAEVAQEADEDETTPAEDVAAEQDQPAHATSERHDKPPEPVEASGSPSRNGHPAHALAFRNPGASAKR